MSRRKLVVFSGGSAANSVIDVFTALCKDSRGLEFVLPVSDNGGSTSEILRVFGGPGIGDVRSRLIRLVPEDTEDEELGAIKCLLNHRLPPANAAARVEWLSLVDGTHELWNGISSEKREVLRSFLTLVNGELLKRQRPNSAFNFHGASCGNLFLTGLRLFFGSFESAIYLFRSITGVPESIQVTPCINSNFAHHIAAGLEDGSVISGQNQISHPSEPVAAEYAEDVDIDDDVDAVEDANLPGTIRELRAQNIVFDKSLERPLPARIDRVWYINPYGHEIRPPANPKVVAAIEHADAVVYSIGSLYTSLAPCLVLRNVGRALAATPSSTPKILLLNGSHDRETLGFTGVDFVRAVVKACCAGGPTAPTDAEWPRYVTHLVYLDGDGTPAVDVPVLKEIGIECVRVYGRRNVDARGMPAPGMRYDPAALQQALSAILGKRSKRADTRRMTVDGSGM